MAYVKLLAFSLHTFRKTYLQVYLGKSGIPLPVAFCHVSLNVKALQ